MDLCSKLFNSQALLIRWHVTRLPMAIFKLSFTMRSCYMMYMLMTMWMPTPTSGDELRWSFQRHYAAVDNGKLIITYCRRDI